MEGEAIRYYLTPGLTPLNLRFASSFLLAMTQSGDKRGGSAARLNVSWCSKSESEIIVFIIIVFAIIVKTIIIFAIIEKLFLFLRQNSMLWEKKLIRLS